MSDTQDDALVDSIARQMAKQRSGNAVFIDGRHNPTATERRLARDILATVRAHAALPTGGTLEDALKETGWPNVYVEYARGEFFAIHGVPARSVVDEMRKQPGRIFGRGDTISEAIQNAIRAALAAGEGRDHERHTR